MGSGDSSVGVLLGDWGGVAVGPTITVGFTSKVALLLAMELLSSSQAVRLPKLPRDREPQTLPQLPRNRARVEREAMAAATRPGGAEEPAAPRVEVQPLLEPSRE